MGGFFNGTPPIRFTGTRVIPSNTLTWAIATYDGAHLRTYIADGDGTNLVLDNSRAQTGTVDTGATITGIDENLVVGAKHRKGHAPGWHGTRECRGLLQRHDVAVHRVRHRAHAERDLLGHLGLRPERQAGPRSGALHPEVGHEQQRQPDRAVQGFVDAGNVPAGSTYNVTVTTRRNPNRVHSRYRTQRQDQSRSRRRLHDRRRLRRGKLHHELDVDWVPGGRRLLHGHLAQHELRRRMGRRGQVHDRCLGVRDVPLLVVPGAGLGDR